MAQTKPAYTILAHPADLGIEATGATLAEAFEHAAEALMSIILDPSTVEAREEKTVEVTASDTERLLVNWLTEILYLYDGNRFACREFTVRDFSGRRLVATVAGEAFSASKHRTKMDVKAVTYHQLSVRGGKDGATVRVFLDV